MVHLVLRSLNHVTLYSRHFLMLKSVAGARASSIFSSIIALYALQILLDNLQGNGALMEMWINS